MAPPFDKLKSDWVSSEAGRPQPSRPALTVKQAWSDAPPGHRPKAEVESRMLPQEDEGARSAFVPGSAGGISAPSSGASTCLPGFIEDDMEVPAEWEATMAAPWEQPSDVDTAGSWTVDAVDGWIAAAKEWIAGGGRLGERDLEKAFEQLEQEAQGQLVGPRQRQLELRHESFHVAEWPQAAELLSSRWSLEQEQRAWLRASSSRDSGERCCEQSHLVGSSVKTRLLRCRTRRDGFGFHIVYGFCELEWELVQWACCRPELTWMSFGGDMAESPPSRLMKLVKQRRHDYHSARASIGLCQGVLEWEIVPDGKCTNMFIGVCTSGMPLEGLVRDDTCLCMHSKGYLHRGLSGQPSLTVQPFLVGDVMCFRLNMDAGTLAISQNGVCVAEASGLVAKCGPIYPYVTVDYPGEGCWIREAPPHVAASTLDRMLAYARRRAERHFSFQLRAAC